MTAKTYGIAVRQRSESVLPVERTWTRSEWMSAAKRVIETHEKVLKELANR